MSIRSLTSSFKNLSLLKQNTVSKACLSTSVVKNAERTAAAGERPQVGASSLFDNVQQEAITTTKEEVTEKEYRFSTANFRASPQKLNMLARQLRNLPIDEAIKQMEFSDKRAAKKIMHTLAFARKNAGDQKDMRDMVVSQAWVGKGKYNKTVRAHGRGQFGVQEIKRAHVKFLFKEAVDVEKTKMDRRNIRGWKKNKKVWTPLLETKPVYNPKPFYNW